MTIKEINSISELEEWVYEYEMAEDFSHAVPLFMLDYGETNQSNQNDKPSKLPRLNVLRLIGREEWEVIASLNYQFITFITVKLQVTESWIQLVNGLFGPKNHHFITNRTSKTITLLPGNKNYQT